MIRRQTVLPTPDGSPRVGVLERVGRYQRGPRRLGILGRPAFRDLWLAHTTSTFGDRLLVVALVLFVADLNGSPGDVGLVLGARTAALVAFVLVGGVWADRLGRARLLMGTDVIRAALHALLAALALTGLIELWHVVVIEAIAGAAEGVFRPARSGLVPSTVPAPEVQTANALTNASTTLADLAGPPLATVLVFGIGAGWAFALDAATFAASALLVGRIRVSNLPAPTAQRRSIRAELIEGFTHVRTRTWLWATVAVFALAMPLGYAPLYVLGPTVSATAYDAPALFGLLTALVGVGAFTGAVAGLRWRPRHPLRAAFLVLAGWPALLVMLGLTAPLPAVLGLAGATGLGFALTGIWWHTTLAEHVPPDALSRVSSYDWLGSYALLPIGYLAIGPVANATNPGAVLITSGLLTAALLALGLLPRQTRTLQGSQTARP